MRERVSSGKDFLILKSYANRAERVNRWTSQNLPKGATSPKYLLLSFRVLTSDGRATTAVKKATTAVKKATTAVKKATTTMKKRKSDSKEGKAEDSPSQLIDARIKEL